MTNRQWQRVVTLTQGIAMLVTDLHGDWERYSWYRNAFLAAYRQRKVQYLIIAGDLIHRESPPEQDKSLEMVLDLLDLQDKYPDAVIYLCGNHELPHIYHITLAKGKYLYTPNFEARLGAHRARVISRFEKLPFYIRTPSGVSVTHAGATPLYTKDEQSHLLFDFDHQQVFDRAKQSLKGQDIAALRQNMWNLEGDYDSQVKKYLAVHTKADPRYNDLLWGATASLDSAFSLLWEALFTRCEWAYGHQDYVIFLSAMLEALSANFHPQTCLVTGHIHVEDGFEIVTKQQLRMASGAHASPLSSARYLLFDVAKPVLSALDLVGGLRHFEQSI